MKHQKLTLTLLFCILCMCFTFSVSAATKYTVKFVDTFDGKETVLSTQSVEKNKAATAPTNIPSHKGFAFSKWSTKFNKITKNMTVKAIYKQTHTIVYFVDKTESKKNVFYLNGKKQTVTGKLLSETPKYFDTKTAVKASDLPKLKKKTGYTSTNWIGIKAGQTFKSPKTIVAKAKYVPISYTIVYVGGDGATGKMAKKKVSYGKTITLAGNSFKKKGYVFQNWTGSDGKIYNNKAKVKNLSTTANGVFTMTANWGVQTYSLTYKPGVNEVIEKQAPYTYHTKKIKRTIIYKFTETGNESTKTEVEKLKVKDSDTPDIFYKGEATETNRFRRIDKKTKKGVMDEVFMSENPSSYKTSDTFIIKNPIRTFYEFKGWKDSKTGKVTKDLCVAGLTGNKKFTATWTKKKYTVIFYQMENGRYSGDRNTYTIDNAFQKIPQRRDIKLDTTEDIWQTRDGRCRFASDMKIGMILKYMEKNRLSELELWTTKILDSTPIVIEIASPPVMN